ncbi:MAG: hypothetical protein U0228_03780 [Myxococcaceae bacterium]
MSVAIEPFELVSPFVLQDPEGPPLAELIERQPPSLLKELLVDPNAIARRMLDPARAASAMSQTLLVLIGGTALAGLLIATLLNGSIWRAALLLPAAVVLAVGAAMGPVAATAVMAGARVPWQLLASALTTAVTAGTLTVSALMPLAFVTMAFDREWVGPLTIVAAFAVGGAVAGRRIRKVLNALAEQVCERTGVELDDERRARIDLIGRVGLVQLTFTLSIALWSLQVIA